MSKGTTGDFCSDVPCAEDKRISGSPY
ncbi:hypothetical protein PLANTIT3_100006 [Plantibacter sp. T3]|nr:hypothetical protein PLANTIT3_100006 [Plantibacter sp. T3]